MLVDMWEAGGNAYEASFRLKALRRLTDGLLRNNIKRATGTPAEKWFAFGRMR